MSLTFTECDLSRPNVAGQVSQFLRENYVEDATGEFRLHYTGGFLTWAHSLCDWCCCLTASDTDQIAGVIIARGLSGRVAEVGFLCVAKNARGRGVARALMDEIRVRAIAAGYTVGIYLHPDLAITGDPVACKLEYYNRLLNPPRLVRLGYALAADKDADVADYVPPPVPKWCRPVTAKDIPDIHGALVKQASASLIPRIVSIPSPNQLRVALLSKHAKAYISKAAGDLALVSYYTTFTRPLNEPAGILIRRATLYYCIPTVAHVRSELVSTALAFAARDGHDVFTLYYDEPGFTKSEAVSYCKVSGADVAEVPARDWVIPMF